MKYSHQNNEFGSPSGLPSAWNAVEILWESSGAERLVRQIPAEFRRYREVMSLSLSIGCLWVLVAAIVALLPMRYQYPPGIALLIAAPVLLGWIAVDHGGWLFAAGLFAFASMFRNPLIYFYRRARGERPEVPA